MALLFADGFDHIQQSSGASDILDKWIGPGAYSASYFAITTGRLGTGKALNVLGLSTAYYINTPSLGSKQTIIVGCGLYPVSTGTAKSFLGFHDSGDNLHITVSINTSGYIEVYRGAYNGTLLGTSSVPVRFNVWEHLQIKLTIDNSAGVVQIYLNGTLVLNLSSQDTQNGGVASIDRIQLGKVTSSLLYYIDDFWVCDTSGSQFNDFMGDVIITALAADADGTHTDFTCSTGSDHYALVDESPPSETDYNSTTTLNHIDSYSHAASSVGGTIHAVQACAHVKSLYGGNIKVTGLCRSGSTPADNLQATEYVVSPTATYARSIWEIEPEDTAAWTNTTLNAAEFGVKVTTLS